MERSLPTPAFTHAPLLARSAIRRSPTAREGNVGGGPGAVSSLVARVSSDRTRAFPSASRPDESGHYDPANLLVRIDKALAFEESKGRAPRLGSPQTPASSLPPPARPGTPLVVELFHTIWVTYDLGTGGPWGLPSCRGTPSECLRCEVGRMEGSARLVGPGSRLRAQNPPSSPPIMR